MSNDWIHILVFDLELILWAIDKDKIIYTYILTFSFVR